MNESTQTKDQAQYLTFYLAGEEYAVGILHVREIIEYGSVTRLPSTPHSIRGVINVRGNVVPIVDLAVKFGLEPTPVTSRTCIVIVELDLDTEQSMMGIVADSVSQVVELTSADIVAPPAFGVPVRTDYLVGIGRQDKNFVLILDIARVLTSEDVVAPVY
jgi:purine-binding chemotaxis protein CheW